MDSIGAPTEALRAFCSPEAGTCHAVGVWQFSSKEPVYSVHPAGTSVADIIGGDSACQASIDGVPVMPEDWAKTLVGDGQTIHFVANLHGGSAGKIIRTVAIAVITYYSAGWGTTLAGAAGTGAASASLWAAGITIAGTLAVNALIPPTVPSAGQAQDPYSQTYSLTGSSNQAAPYGYVPCVLGATRFYPPHAALPYTEISGNDQYLRMLLDLGHGNCDFSDIQIGDSPLTSFDDVEYEITTTPTLYTQDITELQLASVLNTQGDQDLRTSDVGATELSIDLLFPSGLCCFDKKGRRLAAWVYVDVLFRPVGTTTWFGTQASSATPSTSAMQLNTPGQSLYKVQSSQQEALRVGLRWKVPSAGQYEVEIRRTGQGYVDDTQILNAMTWSALRSIAPQNPSATGTMKMALRIKATDQLNGMVSTLSVLAAQKIRTYNKTTATFGDPVATKNPAWIYLWLMTQCPAVAQVLTTDRLDLGAVADWAAECDAKGYVYAAVLDSARSFGDLIRDVLASGRASFGQRNGKYAPVRDLPQTAQVQMLTPANSWDFSYTRGFTTPPHALKVRFTNPEASYQEDQLVVYWDGYDASNATLFDELDLRMVDDPTVCWKLARYHLAVAWRRPTTYTVTADIEHMVCERGDLVHVAHDVVGYGVAFGRVKAIVGNRVVLDAEPILEDGKSYKLRVRRASNTQVSSDFQSIVTWDTMIVRLDMDISFDATQPSPVLTVADTQGIQPGDLFTIGEVGREVLPLIVKAIEPSSDFNATLTLVDADPGVWSADSGTPPPFISQITGTTWCAPPAPPQLNIRIGVSDPDDTGSVGNHVGVLATSSSGIWRLPTYKLQQLGYLPL